LLASCTKGASFSVGFELCCKLRGTPEILLAYEAPKNIKKGKDNIVSIYFAHNSYLIDVNDSLVFNTDNGMNLSVDPWSLFGFQVNLDNNVLYSGKIENFREDGQLTIEKNSKYIFPIKTNWKIDFDLINLDDNTTKEIIIRIVSVEDYASLNEKPLLLWETAEFYGAQSLYIHKYSSNYELSWSNKWNNK
jgi:hypothetical protein